MDFLDIIISRTSPFSASESLLIERTTISSSPSHSSISGSAENKVSMKASAAQRYFC